MALLAHLHPILQRQQLDYTIFVVEQYGNHTFNKARIMNAAFIQINKLYNYQCAVFHDVDLIPEDDRNMYSCPQQPRHMSVAIDEMNYRYKLLYTGLRRYKIDGLNSVKYRIVFIKRRPLYTHIMVDIGKPPPGF